MDFVIVGNVEFLGFLHLHHLLLLAEGLELEFLCKMHMMTVFRGSHWGVFQIVLKFAVFPSEEFLLLLF